MNASVTSLPVFLYMDYGCAIVATDFATLSLPLIDLLWQVIEGVGLVQVSSNIVVPLTYYSVEISTWTNLCQVQLVAVDTTITKTYQPSLHLFAMSNVLSFSDKMIVAYRCVYRDRHF